MAGQTVANLKMVFGADTSGLEKGAKQAKQAVKDFDSTAQGAADAIANMFGVDTGAIEKMTSSLRGLGENLKNTANQGTQAFGKMLSSINGVAAGIAGIGLGAAVAGFRLLTAEAENFRSTVAGANLEMETAAYVNTYKQILHDMNVTTGAAAANMESEFKKRSASIWTYFKNGLLSAVTGRSADLVTGLLNPTQVIAGQAATQGAEKAAAISREQYDLTMAIAAKASEWKNLEAQISELKLKVRDTSLDLNQRTSIQAELEALVERRYSDEYDMRKKLADLQAVLNSLASSGVQDMEKEYNLSTAAENVLLTKKNTLREIAETGRSISAEAAKEAAARKAAADAAAAQAKAIADSRSALGALDLSTSTDLSGIGGLVTGPTMDVVAKAKIVVDEESIDDFSKQLESFIESAVESISSSIGGLVGDLITGGDAWGNFTNAAISSFADMAIAIGKIAVAAGITSEEIKGALSTLSGWGAVAAGGALIALGAAVKTGMSNIAAGNYSGTTSIATAGSSSSYGGNGYAGSNLNVRVTGTLKADGDQLQAVINNTTNRNSHTT